MEELNNENLIKQTEQSKSEPDNKAVVEESVVQPVRYAKPDIEYAGDYVITECGYMDKSEYNRKIYAYNNYLKQENARKNSKDMRIPLILAVISVLLSILGLGLPFAVVGVVLATNRQKVKKSQTLRWAKNIALIGILMNVLMITCFVVALILPK
ncbi:MAG: hypothetical protein ACI4M6_06985 [Christensenellaceae bacterium]